MYFRAVFEFFPLAAVHVAPLGLEAFRLLLSSAEHGRLGARVDDHDHGVVVEVFGARLRTELRQFSGGGLGVHCTPA